MYYESEEISPEGVSCGNLSNILKTGNLSTVCSLSELDKDDPVREGGRQEGSDMKQLEKLFFFFT